MSPADIVLKRILGYAKTQSERYQKLYDGVKNDPEADRLRKEHLGTCVHEANSWLAVVGNEIQNLQRGQARPAEDQWCPGCGGLHGKHHSDCEASSL